MGKCGDCIHFNKANDFVGSRKDYGYCELKVDKCEGDRLRMRLPNCSCIKLFEERKDDDSSR